jgi:cytochrome-b5 reductase
VLERAHPSKDPSAHSQPCLLLITQTIYAFGLPEGQSLMLPVCACILLKAPGKGRKDGGGKDDFDGSDAVRPYTPMSDNSMTGKFELLVKRYDGGAVSSYLFGLEIGSQVEFKHIKFNVKTQYPFEGKKSFTMICGGSGITPMYQALHKLIGTEGDDRPIVLLYGNKTKEDILMITELEEKAKSQPGRLKVVHVVGNRPDEPRGQDQAVRPSSFGRHAGLRVRRAGDV